MTVWLRWTTASAVTLVAFAYAFVNFWAAIDLGFGASPARKSIIAGWGYATLGCFVAGILSGFMAVRAWRA